LIDRNRCDARKPHLDNLGLLKRGRNSACQLAENVRGRLRHEA
jgi:hypothetical protein